MCIALIFITIQRGALFDCFWAQLPLHGILKCAAWHNGHHEQCSSPSALIPLATSPRARCKKHTHTFHPQHLVGADTYWRHAYSPSLHFSHSCRVCRERRSDRLFSLASSVKNELICFYCVQACNWIRPVTRKAEWASHIAEWTCKLNYIGWMSIGSIDWLCAPRMHGMKKTGLARTLSMAQSLF